MRQACSKHLNFYAKCKQFLRNKVNSTYHFCKIILAVKIVCNSHQNTHQIRSDPRTELRTSHHQTNQRGRVGGVENKRRCSRYVLGGEIGDDAVDEILSHDDGADRLPVRGVLAEQQADGFQRDLHERRRIAHRPHFHQMLLLYRFHRCTLQTVRRCSVSAIGESRRVRHQHEARAREYKKERNKKGI